MKENPHSTDPGKKNQVLLKPSKEKKKTETNGEQNHQ
jgi:hypothetical protein